MQTSQWRGWCDVLFPVTTHTRIGCRQVRTAAVIGGVATAGVVVAALCAALLSLLRDDHGDAIGDAIGEGFGTAR